MRLNDQTFSSNNTVITHNMERFNKQTMFDTIQTEWVDMNCVQYRWNDGLIACLYDKGVGSKKLDTSLYEAEWKRWCYGQDDMLMSLIV